MNTTKAPVQTGLWRNAQGSEMNVFRPVISAGPYLTLGGGMWEGIVRGGALGPTRYLLTAESLAECGYEFIEGEN